MSLTLTNTQINNTYQGLIKLGDSVAISATEQVLSDGLGNDSALSLGTISSSFTGVLDLSGATITGFAAGGLVAGSGANSLQSALTSTPANANQSSAIAIGNGARAEGGSNSIAIGESAECLTGDSIVIGVGCNSSAGPSITIGRNASAQGSVSTSMGNSANVSADQSIGISGENCTIGSGNRRSIAMGRQAEVQSQNSIAIGNFAKAKAGSTGSIVMATSVIGGSDVTGLNSLVITPGDYGGIAAQAHSIILGTRTLSDTSAVLSQAGIAIGRDAQVNSGADGAVALGSGVIAETSNTTTVALLQIANYGSVNYVDDAAAATGGIPLGGVYHNAGAMRIRIA